MKINNNLDFNNAKRLKVTLLKSASGRLPNHKATLNSMGLRRIGQSVSVANNKAMLGMIQMLIYLLKVEAE